ncbi:MAG TPA: CBS domain-containing protein [Ktedonobacterales bacterium]|jgi:CBS-domain-containing membrane protein
MHARDIMTHELITIRPEASVRDAARRLSDYNISGMPVVDQDGRMAGIITEADLISKEGDTVADIMTQRVVGVSESTTVDEIAQILTSNRFKRVPVLREERLVGIVSRADIVRMMASRWVCPVCGAIQLGRVPRECPSCGIDGSRFERELNIRPEITSRQ